MKKTQIKKLLDGVMTKFIDKAKKTNANEADKELFVDCINKGYFAGGCFASMIDNKYINDFDFYFSSSNDADFVNDFIQKNMPNEIVANTPNAITLKNKLQFMLKYSGEAEKIVDSFDFAHLKAYMHPFQEPAIADYIYRHIAEKELVYTGSLFPLASLLRTRKYIARGWHITGENMVKIVFDVTAIFEIQKTKPELEYNYDTIDAVRDELIVDVDYFVNQMSGIDPLTIMTKLESSYGLRLSLNEVIQKLR